MSKKTRGLLILGAILVLAGCIIFVGVMIAMKWNFTALSTAKYENNDYEITESFTSITIETNTADVTLVASIGSRCVVECYEEEKMKHAVSVENGALVIKAINEKKWYDYIGINFTSPKIKVYLPAGDYGALEVKASTAEVTVPSGYKFSSVDISLSTGSVDFSGSCEGKIKIKTTTGNICLNGATAGEIDLCASTGKIEANGVSCVGEVKTCVTTGKTELSNIACGNFTSTGSTGDISMTNLVASGNLSVERSTGDVKFTSCDATEMFVKTSTGNIEGSLRSAKVFVYDTSTGKVNLPQTTTGGACQLITDTGDIKINIE